jgi:hypothetical protein
MKYRDGLLSFLVVLAATLASPAALAQRPPSTSMLCAPTIAVSAQLADIAADPRAWIGKCVTIAGVYSNERVYADLDAVYGLSKASIGGYVDNRGNMLGFSRGEFTGRIADCEKAQNDIDSGLLKSPGILIDNTRQAGCVKPEGLFLQFMSQGEMKPAGFVRRLAPAKGDLVTPQKDWDHVDTLRLQGGRFLEALRAGDRAALKGAAGNDYNVEQLLTADDTAFSALRKSKGVLPMQILQSTAVKEPNFEGQICWCLTKDCSKRWPIATRDADNQKGRPYACLRVGGPTGGDPTQRFTFAEVGYEGVPDGKK